MLCDMRTVMVCVWGGGVRFVATAGPRKALPGALLWGTACVAGQLAVHAVAEWRQVRGVCTALQGLV